MHDVIHRNFLYTNLVLSILILVTSLLRPLIAVNVDFDAFFWMNTLSTGCVAFLGIWNVYLRKSPSTCENISPAVLSMLSVGTITYIRYLPPFTIVLTYLLGTSGIAMGKGRVLPYILLPVAATIQASILLVQHNPHAAILYAISGPALMAAVYTGRNAQQRWVDLRDAYRRSLNASTEIADANRRLRDEVMKTEILAKLTERNRVGREIHDTVGYTLTAVLMQINACQDELRRGAGGLEDRLKSVERIVREAIGDVRKEVHLLREEELNDVSWKNRWLALCRVFDDSTRVRIRVNIEKEFANLDSEIGETVSRVLQEALTNSLRHSEAYMVDIAVGQRDDLLLIRISDNGIGTDRITIGNGLKGIRERVTALGGELMLSSELGRGFDIGIDIPYSTEVTRSF